MKLTREQVEECRANPTQAMIRREQLCDMALRSLSPAVEREWIACSERLPDTFQKVEVCDVESGQRGFGTFLDAPFRKSWDTGFGDPTHWREAAPLPAAPKGEGE